MDMEIEFLHKSFTDKDPKLLVEHIQRMADGEAPFFATTLSLVYDKLVEKAFAQSIPSGSGLGKSVEVRAVVDPCPPFQASPSASSVPLTPVSGYPPSFSALDPGPEPAPSDTPTPLTWLRCNQCRELVGLEDLFDGLRCPHCPPRSAKKGRPYMQCSLCRVVRVTPRNSCIKISCGARFR